MKFSVSISMDAGGCPFITEVMHEVTKEIIAGHKTAKMLRGDKVVAEWAITLTPNISRSAMQGRKALAAKRN